MNMYVYTCDMNMYVYMWRSEYNLYKLTLSTVWAQGTELRLPSLVARAFD